MAKQRSQIDRLVNHARQDQDVLAVILFGSVASDAEGPLSDIDLCVVLDPRHAGLDAKSMAGKRLEYLSDFDLDVQVFQQLPLYVRRRVLKEGQVLFARSEDLLYEVAYRTAQAFEDFKRTYDGYLEHIARAGS